MQKTGIEYMTHSWNPIAMRCTKISDGCKNCWHLPMAKRHAANPGLPKAMRDARGGGKPWLNERELDAPIRLKKPSTIGVQFMGDLFHKDIEDAMIDKVFAVMALAPRHTFLVLTKRPERMREYMESWPNGMGRGHHIALRIGDGKGPTIKLPLPNVWLGTSVENQKAADERLPFLIKTPAAIRWMSYEPALGPVDIEKSDYLFGRLPESEGRGLDWVVAAGESGHGARPSRPEWFQSLRDQCIRYGTDFMFKGWGDWAPGNFSDKIAPPSHFWPKNEDGAARCMSRIGKKAAGRHLDGKIWDQYPKING